MAQVIQICNDLCNVGDILAPIITSRLFGVEVVRVFKSVPQEYDGIPILAGLGSCLGYYGEWPLRVWGTGFEPGYMDRKARAYQGNRPLWRVHAVRGHVTRTILKLGGDVAIGDPAILTPRIYQPQAVLPRQVRYFVHCDNRECPLAEEGVERISARMDPFDAIDLICASRFVFTEALHVAILAQAYGIPWAWSLDKHIRAMVKWFDWFSSLGVRARCFAPSELAEARRWYDKVHRSFTELDEDSLLKAFPADVIHERL